MAEPCHPIARLLLVAVLSLPLPAVAAENTTLLSISGDRIDYLETPANQPADETIASYYSELPESLQLRLRQHRKSLTSLLADYEFALNAADTAEMNAMLSKVTAEWVRILRLHNEHFTDPARAHLRQLYGRVYPSLARR